jgi:hypothetical protein
MCVLYSFFFVDFDIVYQVIGNEDGGENDINSCKNGDVALIVSPERNLEVFFFCIFFFFICVCVALESKGFIHLQSDYIISINV